MFSSSQLRVDTHDVLDFQSTVAVKVYGSVQMDGRRMCMKDWKTEPERVDCSGRWTAT